MLLAAILTGCATTKSAAPSAAAQSAPPVAVPMESPETAPVAAAEDAASRPDGPPVDLPATPATADDVIQTGRDVYLAFREGMATPECNDTAGSRWRKHFRQAPARLLKDDTALLPLFGHVVGEFRKADLPTEFALIPFIESGYNPRARSKAGPAGMWQFIALTARNHGITVNKHRDGRMSPIESTRAAVAHLGGLYHEFGDDWRLAIMAYNAGEFRIKGAMRRGGISLAEAKARPAAIPGLSPITYAYVQKLHALACLFEEAGEDESWLARLDHPVRPLQAAGASPAQPADDAPEPVAQAAEGAGPAPKSVPRTHKVKRGDSLWSIARRYGMSVSALLSLNRLEAGSVLRPGMVLRLAGDTIR